jgi:hypothetical protein
VNKKMDLTNSARNEADEDWDGKVVLLSESEYEIFRKALYSVCPNCSTMQRNASWPQTCTWCSSPIITVGEAKSKGLVLIK